MTPIDFEFFRLKVNVTIITFVKEWFPLIILRIIYLIAFIFKMLISLSEDMNPVDIGFTWSKVKVTRIKFVKKT